MTELTAAEPADAWRATAVVTAAVLQIVAGAIGGIGVWNEPVGEVANSYPTLLLPAGEAFTIWSLIYVAFAGLAVRQALPTQRGREVHRRTGWWLVAAGVLNAGWIALFTQRQITLAQVVIVALLGCLAVAAARLTRIPATGWPDRLLLHMPVTIYTGWVAVATVAGAATTGAALGNAPTTIAAVLVLALTGIAVGAAALRLSAVAGLAMAVCWALAWIVVATPAMQVRYAGLVAVAVVLAGFAVRLYRANRTSTAAWG